MSLLDKARAEEPKRPRRETVEFTCAGCGKVERQFRNVKECMHRCPKSGTMRPMKREET